MKRPIVVIGVVAVLVAFAAGAAAYDLLAPPPAPPGVQVAQAEPQAPRVVPQSRGEVQLSFAPVVRAVAPSVVNVYATTIVAGRASPFDSDPFFQRFFGGSPFGRSQPRESQSLGSGVIVDGSGVILTNSHVVHGATDVRVATSDGREYAVDVAIDDAKTDLAVLRIRDSGGRSFPAVSFADSDQLQVGDLVLAIGNPFGVGQTVTSGIVSALARTGVESNNYEFFIQTDAAINPGNSGGALVDLDGRLVGINTAIFSQTGGSVGIGFAIPANMARVVADAGISGGALIRPWFGARTQEVTGDIANSLGLELPRGALIAEIAPGGTAEAAGFRPGDVILAVDGAAIEQPSALDYRLATHRVGDRVTLSYRRAGRDLTTAVTLSAAPGADGTLTATFSGNTRFAGATVETVTPYVAQEQGLAFDFKGVVITGIDSGSPADQMGLRHGDIILSLNGREVTTAEDFKTVVSSRPNAWQVVLQRGGRVFQSYVSG